MKVARFESAQAFREWLEAHHSAEPELWVGFHTRKSGRAGLTYPEALDEVTRSQLPRVLT